MDTIIGYTKGGKTWEPGFISALDMDSCIGCGRCYKVCSRDVFDLIEKEECDDDDDFYDDDNVMMVMTIKDEMDCIGCGACAKVCPKRCHSFESASLA